MYKLLLATALMGYLLPGALALCKPDCTNKNPGDKVEDPNDCRKYFICMAGEIPSDSSLDCSVHNIFDSEQGDCVSGNTCTVSCVKPDCHMTCTDSVDLISDPSDCSVYKVCLAGGVVGQTVQCPADEPYFNGKYCQGNKDKCCTDLCIPYCYHNVVQAPDPEDCRSYYICEHEGAPDDNHHFTCDDGKVFDISAGRCVVGAQCKILCEGESGYGPGSTSTPIDGCKNSYNCPSGGYFPQCNTCQPGYFECSGAGQDGVLKSCSTGQVFNTNPDFPICVSTSNCPYYP